MAGGKGTLITFTPTRCLRAIFYVSHGTDTILYRKDWRKDRRQGWW
jgi:hypothetical protein